MRIGGANRGSRLIRDSLVVELSDDEKIRPHAGQVAAGSGLRDRLLHGIRQILLTGDLHPENGHFSFRGPCQIGIFPIVPHNQFRTAEPFRPQQLLCIDGFGLGRETTREIAVTPRVGLQYIERRSITENGDILFVLILPEQDSVDHSVLIDRTVRNRFLIRIAPRNKLDRFVIEEIALRNLRLRKTKIYRLKPYSHLFQGIGCKSQSQHPGNFPLIIRQIAFLDIIIGKRINKPFGLGRRHLPPHIVQRLLLTCLLVPAIQLIQDIIVSIALVIIHISPYGRQRIPQNPAQVGYRAVTTEKIDSRLLRTNGIVLLLQKSLLPVVLQQAPGTSGRLRLHALRPEQSLVITCRKILTEITVEHEIPTLLRFGSLRDKRFFRFGRRNIIGMFGQPSLLDGVDPGRDLRTESLGREHFAFERENLSAVSLLCGRIFPQHRTQSCNPGLHLVDPDLQPTVLIPKRNVFRIRLQGRNTGPRRVGSSSHDNDREGQK